MIKGIVVSPESIVSGVQIPAIDITLTTAGQLLNPEQPTAHQPGISYRLAH